MLSALLTCALTLGVIGIGIPTKAEEVEIVPPAPTSLGILNPIEQAGTIDATTVLKIVTEKLADPRLGAGVTGYVIDANSNQVLIDINSVRLKVMLFWNSLYSFVLLNLSVESIS